MSTLSQDAYTRQIGQAFDEAWQTAQKQKSVSIDLAQDRLIIFSDHHRGNRNRADDFRLSERGYNAALAYYFTYGHTLVVLGDCEELWEERPKNVLKSYEYSLSLEAKFHQAGRYWRFWGNHDDNWRYESQVKKYLQPIFGEQPLPVHETLRVQVRDQGKSLGWLFLAHGHQGTTASDKAAPISRLFVRYVWRPYQRIRNISLNTPSQDWQLRERHNIALYAWAAAQKEKVVLIAGHTHRPVFASKTHAEQIQEQLTTVNELLKGEPQNPNLWEESATLAAELEWTRSQNNQKGGAEGKMVKMQKPCYFNTGCCSFSDGDITGLEIADGEMRLIKFPNDQKKPKPRTLAHAPLKEIFDQC